MTGKSCELNLDQQGWSSKAVSNGFEKTCNMTLSTSEQDMRLRWDIGEIKRRMYVCM